MNNTISASKAKNNFGYLIDLVYAKGKTITITRNNKPIAKVSPVYSYKSSDISLSLKLNDNEYKKVKEAARKFRESFEFSF